MTDAKRKPNQTLRKARGSMTQQMVADKINEAVLHATGREALVAAKNISDYECGFYYWPRSDVRNAFCKVFGVARPQDLGFHPPVKVAPVALKPVDLLTLAQPRTASGTTECVKVPAGRSYLGVEIAGHYWAADRVGRDVLLIDPDEEALTALRRPDRRALVVAVDQDSRQYVADGRRFVDRAERRTGQQAVPLANIVDDMTVGIIWATMNADTSLLADDAQLVRSQAYVAHHEKSLASQAAVEEVPTLNPLASQWLGSRFCSRHVLRHLDQIEDEPLFWTREQRGEEAANWLLWTHKFDYLRRTSRRFTNLRRGFCIPESEVRASPRYERVMLLLAMALMEAFGIRVELSVEPEHSEVEGFVLANQAIVANWIGSPGLWCVEASAPPSRLSTYRKLADQVVGESLTSQSTPVSRLAFLASHLDIPWGWFRKRCVELAAVGVDDIAHPSSRLLSTRGLNTAIRYVAYIDLLEGDDFARR
ncbi:hypothetical protein GCM10029976_042410 [Kribbella albertanoniae]|uniref:XRE family transcriptional regulator n=1 Tax=Kribbella albertanoniae TaxID=1266829 RepID=A0A4R4QES3_9ACTN|nr:XRE family transcriptional regulator [Kribbella albertanoniae]TDC34027.1 XRE family transcriptional regulator [Kribbella albertanoniae]